MIRCIYCRCPLSNVTYTIDSEDDIIEVSGHCYMHYTVGAEWDSSNELAEVAMEVPYRTPVYESRYVPSEAVDEDV